MPRFNRPIRSSAIPPDLSARFPASSASSSASKARASRHSAQYHKIIGGLLSNIGKALKGGVELSVKKQVHREITQITKQFRGHHLISPVKRLARRNLLRRADSVIKVLEASISKDEAEVKRELSNESLSAAINCFAATIQPGGSYREMTEKEVDQFFTLLGNVFPKEADRLLEEVVDKQFVAFVKYRSGKGIPSQFSERANHFIANGYNKRLQSSIFPMSGLDFEAKLQQEGFSGLMAPLRATLKRKVDQFSKMLFSSNPNSRAAKAQKEISEIHGAAKARLERDSRGCGGAYCLYNSSGQRAYMIKPVGEDSLQIHNSKNNAAHFGENTFPFLPTIPQFLGAQATVAACRISRICGLNRGEGGREIPPSVPETNLVVLEDNAFYDITERLPKGSFEASEVNKKKLCSAMEYLQNAQDFDLRYKTVEEKKVGAEINHASFENANIQAWLNYDVDANLGNFMVFDQELPAAPGEKSRSETWITKIDSDFTFPVRNEGLINFLAEIPIASRPLSDRAKKLILAVPLSECTTELRNLGMPEASITAFEERVAYMQEIVNQRENVTIAEMNELLRTMSSRGA